MSRVGEWSSELYALLREAELLGSCASLLGWDEQTKMPPKGGALRANQMGLLAGLTHEYRVRPRIGELLHELEAAQDLGAPDDDLAVNVREARRLYDRATKLPKALVEELSKTTSLAQQAWKSARKDNDFAGFEPWLAKIVTLKREEAQAVGFAGVPYDALLDEYEPAATAAEIAAVFKPLRDELVTLVAAIAESGKRPPTEILERFYPVEAQRVFGEAAAKMIGFDIDAGRVDESAHPFCSGIGPGDCRLTTRYNAHHFPGAFFGMLHEAGHGIYEQGLVAEHFGLARGQTISLGIHESQSRLWENFVGRSRDFWTYMFPHAQTAFPAALGQVTVNDFYAAINDVRPSLIRVEADEVTYNLHIMLRFELELALLDGSLSPADVPTAWNEKFETFFAMTPPSNREGCLQDVHWSAGLFGYFPTYALGNMYAAQLILAASRDLGDLGAMWRTGQFKPLKQWLNQNVHLHGKRYAAKELIRRVTGESLNGQPLVAHLKQKYGELYGLR